MITTVYYIVPRGPGGAEIVLDDFNAAKRRADKIDALVRVNGLKGEVVHGAGGRRSVAVLTAAQRAETERVVGEMRAERLSNKKED